MNPISIYNIFSPELLVSFPFTPPLCNCVYELTESVSEEGSCSFHFEDVRTSTFRQNGFVEFQMA